MSDFRFLLARFPDPAWEEATLIRRLSELQSKLRQDRLAREAGIKAIEDDAADDGPTWNRPTVTPADRRRIERRARCLAATPRAKGEMGHLQRDDMARLDPLRKPLSLVRLASLHHADEIAAELHADFPWMAAATTVVMQAMRRSVRDGAPGLYIPPLLLDGPTGIGKSTFARKLGALIGVETVVIECTGETAGFSAVGVQEGWGSACPGRPLEAILRTRVANPIIVLDEIEKAGQVTSNKGQNYALTEALLPLLERTTARRWTCPYFRLPFDMGYLSWVLTSNYRALLPAHFLSRCRVVEVPAPSLAQLLAFARSEGERRGLSKAAVDALCTAMGRLPQGSRTMHLRTVLRLLDTAADLEAQPLLS